MSWNRTRAVIAAALAVAASAWATPDEDGLYATVQTSMGSFTVRLEFGTVPGAVANFVGLAEGTQPWIDSLEGAVSTAPFYDGSGFHRVIDGFMVQGGSPHGIGDGGPGYSIPDEFDPALRHDCAGILSMANSGIGSTESQFFVTLAPTAWLDDLHTILGDVVEGMDVVTAIGSVPTDDGDQPITPVTIETVVIDRVGAAAAAFDPGDHGLPGIGSASPRILGVGGECCLRFDREINHAYHVFDALDMSPGAAWSGTRVALYCGGLAPSTTDIDITAVVAANPRRVFRAIDVAYSQPLETPSSLVDGQLSIDAASAGWTIAYLFYGDGTGLWLFNGGADSGRIQSWSYDPDPYRGSLTVVHDLLVPMKYSLRFGGADDGRFSGTAYTSNPFSIGGTFAWFPPEG